MDIIGIDTETTGTDPGARVLELAAVLVNPASVLILIEADCNPGIPIVDMDEATALNGFTQERAEIADLTGWNVATLIEKVDKAMAMHPGAVVAMHSAPFDCGMLAYEAARVGLEIPDWPVVCTLEVSRAVGATGNNKLETVAAFYGLQWDGPAHRALGDAWKAAAYYQRIAEIVMGSPIVALPSPRPFSEWVAQWDGAYTETFPPGFGNLPELCRAGGPLSFSYVNAKGKASTRTITPQGYAMRGGVLHFHGYCHQAGQGRAFRADRVVSIQAAIA